MLHSIKFVALKVQSLEEEKTILIFYIYVHYIGHIAVHSLQKYLKEKIHNYQIFKGIIFCKGLLLSLFTFSNDQQNCKPSSAKDKTRLVFLINHIIFGKVKSRSRFRILKILLMVISKLYSAHYPQNESL